MAVGATGRSYHTWHITEYTDRVHCSLMQPLLVQQYTKHEWVYQVPVAHNNGTWPYLYGIRETLTPCRSTSVRDVSRSAVLENADGTYSCVSHGEHGREGLHVGQVPHSDLRTERRREETERTPAWQAGGKSIVPVLISADVVAVQRIDRYDNTRKSKHHSSVPQLLLAAAVPGSAQSGLYD